MKTKFFITLSSALFILFIIRNPLAFGQLNSPVKFDTLSWS